MPTEPLLQDLPAADVIRDHCYGGMPTQIGWCCGDNRKLNCLEYHRDSEFNLGTVDFILLLAKQEDVKEGVLETSKVKAFLVPAGTRTPVTPVPAKAPAETSITGTPPSVSGSVTSP